MQQYDFFYDGQIRRFLLQIVKAFSGFQYEIVTQNGPELRSVPCRMATMNRQVAHIMKGGSENNLNSLPMISVWMKEASPDRARTQAPGLVTTVHAQEREITGDTMTSTPGNKVSVERLMPHPLTVRIQVDLWTSNEMQKHQLWEQIYMMFNVAFPIQSSDNPLDWTALTYMELEDTVWTSRTLQSSGGSDETVDVSSFVFKLPMWISPPAKLKKQRLIHQVITNLNYGITEKYENPDVDGYFDSYAIPEGKEITFVETYERAIISVKDRYVYLTDNKGVPLSWSEYLNQHGFNQAHTIIHLKTGVESDYKTDVQFIINETDEPSICELTYLLETLPTASLSPVKGIIDPMRIHAFSALPSPVAGDRYIIINDVGSSSAWGMLVAKANDIIEFDGNKWVVATVANQVHDEQYLINESTNKMLKLEGGSWTVAVEGEYPPGLWRMRPLNG